MARRGGEFTAGTCDRVGIAVALGAGHGKRIGGDELVERSAMAVGRDVTAFRLGDLQEVASNAGQGDGLRGSCAFVGRRHSLQREVVEDEDKGGTGQKANKRAHERIVAGRTADFKCSARRVVLENNAVPFRTELQGRFFFEGATASPAQPSNECHLISGALFPCFVRPATVAYTECFAVPSSPE